MEDNKTKLAFNKTNYILMLIGIGILGIGFFIMTLDKHTYGFGFLGLTLGPTIVVIGFIEEIFAIRYKGKKKE